MKLWIEKLRLSINAWIQNRKNKKQIDEISRLNKEIIEYDLRFLEAPHVFINKRKNLGNDRK